MEHQFFHVFRNTPFGRETFMHSAHFCQRTGRSLNVYIPEHPQFLMYFDRSIVTVDLDRAFLRSHDTAKGHAEEILSSFDVDYTFYKPTQFAASTLPEIPTAYAYMCCPRSISDLSTKVGLGYIGPRVRNIIKHAAFPVFIPSSVYKEWTRLVCFFGGSVNSIHAMTCALRLQQSTGLPLEVFTQGEGKQKDDFRKIMTSGGVYEKIDTNTATWTFFEKGDFRENLYAVPHDAIVIVGAYGHGLARELFFGSKMEAIQSVLPNSMLIVGPNYPTG